MKNREVFARDPLSFVLPNDGVTVVSDPQTPGEWAVLRYELESFVCSGEYRKGLERVLSTFLGHLDQPKQPAVWVSGFYGSGKSHFVRVLQYLWRDIKLPDGAQARSLVALPEEIRAHLVELTTAGRREGGLWAAAGTLAPGDSIALALLGILFRGAGLPRRYPQARFVAWLRRSRLHEAVEAYLRARGASLSEELNDMYVSPLLAEAVLSAYPGLASTPEDVLARFSMQFPNKTEISDDEMLGAVEEVLTLQSSKPGKWPLTLIVLDELQQSIGNDSDRALQVQEIVEACSSRFGSRLLVVGTGQAALEATPQLSKLQDRFTVRVTLSDQDVQQVVREVVLRKSPDRVGVLRDLLDSVSGEISRHLAGSRIAPRPGDDEVLVSDYPLLPSRRRFWEHLLRAIDRQGVSAQLRTQLRIVLEAARTVAERPLGTVIGADFIYSQRRQHLLQSGVLLPEIDTLIAQLDDGTPDGALRSRLCATIFLISELPTEGPLVSGVRPTAEMLADLLVEQLPQGSAALRQRIPELLQQLVDDGSLMLVGDEYRLQTRESREWERERRSRYQAIAADEVRMASERAAVLRQAVTEALKGVRLVQGASKTPRSYQLHFGLEAPPSNTDAVPVWVRDEWSVAEKVVREDAQAAGTESPIVFVMLPRLEDDALREALAGYAAAKETLEAHPVEPTTPEGIDARNAMRTRQDLARNRIGQLVRSILEDARVYQGGGNEVTEGSFRASVEKALGAALVRLFPQFAEADDPRWSTVLKRASQGGADALSAIGHQGDPHDHRVCKEIQSFLGTGGKSGAEVRKQFMGPPYGWPQDAVDGALLALVAEGRAEVRDRGGQARSVKEIAQSRIGALSFRNVTVIVTTQDRIRVRKLLVDMGVSVKNGEEAQGVVQALQKLKDLAEKTAGPPPLPEQPSLAAIDELLSKGGNEQVVAVAGRADELLGLYRRWQQDVQRRNDRWPRWQLLQRLLAHAAERPVAAQVRPQVEAIVQQRSLLSDPDPVRPLISELCQDLRAAVNTARQRLVDAREEALEALKATAEWNKLSDAQWRAILQRHNLGPVPELNIGTEEELLEALDACPLRTWEDWAVAMPMRIMQAREEAARLLAPTAVRVRPRSTTLHTPAEVETYLSELRQEILTHIEAGRPVIL